MVHTLVKDKSEEFFNSVIKLLREMEVIVDRVGCYDPEYPCIGWDDEDEELCAVDPDAEDDDGKGYENYHSVGDFLKVVEDALGLNQEEVITDKGDTIIVDKINGAVEIGGYILTKNDIGELNDMLNP